MIIRKKYRIITNLVVTIMALLYAMAVNVNAQTLEFNVCKSGCEYSDLETVFSEIYNLSENSNIIINFKDNETYECEKFDNSNSLSSITINGNNATINANDYVYFRTIQTININNITINSIEGIAIQNTQTASISDTTVKGNSIMMVGLENRSNVDYINNKEYLNTKFKFENVVFDASAQMGVSLNESSFDNCTISSPLITYFSDLYFTNSNINKLVEAGARIPGGNIHIYSSNNLGESIKRKYLSSEDGMNGYFTEEILNTPGLLVEREIWDEIIQVGISPELTNNIYYYQDIDKTIKVNTSISDFESEFINTYENSEGYDDIKDLPIEWKSENESVAKIENGVIVPVSIGNVNIIGKRGNDIYTIHLTVEKESVPEKIDKMTIKVPITGNKIKVWIVFVGVLLLSVIGRCTYLLIKNSKTTK